MQYDILSCTDLVSTVDELSTATYAKTADADLANGVVKLQSVDDC